MAQPPKMLKPSYTNGSIALLPSIYPLRRLHGDERFHCIAFAETPETDFRQLFSSVRPNMELSRNTMRLLPTVQGFLAHPDGSVHPGLGVWTYPPVTRIGATACVPTWTVTGKTRTVFDGSSG